MCVVSVLGVYSETTRGGYYYGGFTNPDLASDGGGVTQASTFLCTRT